MLCTSCGETVTGEGPPTVCSCGHPLEVRFNWGDGLPFREGISQALPSLWRYLSVLPPLPEDQITTLNEGWTPLIDAGEYEGISVSFKDETMNPTGSFKDRGMTMAVSHLRPFGVRHVCLPSAGNAGVAAATYCSKAGIGCHLFLPERIPGPFVEEAKRYGADVTLAGKTMAQAAARMERDRSLEWFDLSTLREPFRVEGKKTLGYEIAEQLGWGFPDAVIYPTGGGTGLIGMWKAFNEIRDLGWTTDELPRMVAVQSSGCAPVVRAFADGEDQVRPWEESHTAALGLHAPNPLGGSWMLRVLRESGGTAVMVEEERIHPAREKVAAVSGTNPSPEAAVAWLGFEKLLDSGWIKRGDRVVIPITGSAERYV